jgi:hypothetical protein
MTNGNITSSQNELFVNFCVHCLTSESKTLQTLQYKWSDMSTRGFLFQSANTISIQLVDLVKKQTSLSSHQNLTYFTLM